MKNGPEPISGFLFFFFFGLLKIKTFRAED
jgi:hypothetical protein